MRLDLYILEECAKARNEGIDMGREEGIGLGEAKGRKKERVASVRLAQALIDAGRADEIAEVLADDARRDALVREFGLTLADNHSS